jgi:hypothetical protein
MFGTLIEKGNDVQVGLNLSDKMVFSLCKLGPRNVSSAVFISANGHPHEKGRTILFSEGFVDDIMIIHISIYFVFVEVEDNNVTHRHPSEIVARETRTPVFTEVSKHIDVIAQKIEYRLTE